MTTKKLVNNFTQHQFKFNVHQDSPFEQKKAMNITEAILYAKLDELYLKDSNVPKVSRLCQIIPQSFSDQTIAIFAKCFCLKGPKTFLHLSYGAYDP